MFVSCLNMADELWQELLLRLEYEQICLDDFPTTEEPLWGTLKELGFTSYLDRVKLCKEISAGRQKEALRVVPSKTFTPANTTNPVSSQLNCVLFDSGQRGLAAACRSAHTMALTTCQTTQDTELWLQMPRTVASIGADIQAYEVMQETRRKHPLRGCSAQGASIALRDTLTLRMHTPPSTARLMTLPVLSKYRCMLCHSCDHKSTCQGLQWLDWRNEGPT